MGDLYETLGLKKGATRDDVRKAYRRAAKKAHPDAGGDARTFAVVSLAHDVLSDDERRAQYDATGSTEDKPQDKSISFVMEGIDAVMNECTRRGLSCENVDVVADAIRTLRMRIEKMDEGHRDIQAQIEAGKKLARRFKAKRGKPNRISILIEGRLRQMEDAARQSVRDRPSIERAIEILKDHTFDYETMGTRQQTGSTQFVYMNFQG